MPRVLRACTLRARERLRLAHLCFAAPALFWISGAAAACDPLLADRPALFDLTLELRGRQPASAVVHLPGQSRIVVLAREDGADVTLEVATGATVVGSYRVFAG